ncbi:MAG TPA: hypothetical protein VGJ00_04035 [Rhabdochlamydiaceae bacterium]|jgi:hypothetical protein
MTVLTSLTGTQNYFDNDGLFRRYGTDKTVPATGGEYRNPSETREIEFMLDLTKLTTTAQIIDEQVYMPLNVWVESADIDVQIAGATGTTFSVGLVKSSTRDSADATDAAIIAAEVTGVWSVLGNKLTYFPGVAKAGSVLGTTTTTSNAPSYFTAKITGSTFTTGLIKVRIRYRSGTVTTQ